MKKIFLLGCGIFAVGCSWFSREDAGSKAVSSSPAEKEAVSPREETQQSKERHELLRVVKIASQADQVMREAWWVVSAERRPAPRSHFGKLLRAALFMADGKLATKGIFSCDAYRMEVEKNGPQRTRTFFETCQNNNHKKVLVWKPLSSKSAKVEFFPDPLAEIIGLKASLLSKPLVCDLSWSDTGVLSTLSCPQWEQDKGNELIRLTHFEYRQGQGQLLVLRGEVLKDLQAVRRIEADVPLEGKITVTETELAAPEATPPAPVAASPAGSAAQQNKYADPTAAEPEKGRGPVNPDLIQRAGVRPGAATEATPSVKDQWKAYGEEMRKRGYAPVVGPDGEPVLDEEGRPVWDRPSHEQKDEVIFVPHEEEEPEAPGEKNQKPPVPGTQKNSEPEFKEIPANQQ